MFDGLSFNNGDLQTAVDSIEEKLDELKPQLERVREDISRLDQWLQLKGFCVPVSEFISSSREFDGSEDGGFTELFEYVAWDQHNGTWRLLLKQEEGEGCLALGQHCYSFAQLDAIPLVEAPEAVQLKAADVLAKFVRKVGNAVKTPAVEQAAGADDEPRNTVPKYLTVRKELM